MNDVKEILHQQLQLLAEESKNVQPNDRGFKPCLVDYSNAICQIVDSYVRLLEIEKAKTE